VADETIVGEAEPLTPIAGDAIFPVIGDTLGPGFGDA
jgi:hypothetical protein